MYFTLDSCEERGTYGDMYGALNTLFSGFAFVGIIISILMQNKEISMQRDDLKLQREEMEKQREEMELTRNEVREQNSTMFLQRFENTFFKLVELHQNIVSGFQIEETNTFASNTQHRGKECFTFFFNLIREKDVMNADEYYDLYDNFQSILGVYFTSLYRILKYIKRQEKLTNEEKYEYSSILRSNLSDDELWLVSVNCIIGHGKVKFMPLVIEFKFCKNINVSNYYDFAEKYFNSPSYKNAFPKF